MDIRWQNLSGKPLGTTDGTTVTGSKLLLETIKSVRYKVVGDTGTVSWLNPDWQADYLRADQEYILYNQILQPGDTSAARTWRWPRTRFQPRCVLYHAFVDATAWQPCGHNAEREGRAMETLQRDNGPWLYSAGHGRRRRRSDRPPGGRRGVLDRPFGERRSRRAMPATGTTWTTPPTPAAGPLRPAWHRLCRGLREPADPATAGISASSLIHAGPALLGFQSRRCAG